MPRIRRSFDFFCGAPGTGSTGPLCGTGALCGRGALCARGGAAAGGGGGSVGWGGWGCCKLEEVGEPVGPVFLGRTAVGAEDVVAIVAPKSGGGLLAGFSLGGSTGGVPGLAAVAAIVALGSKGLSAVTNKPPSTVQNF